MSAAWDLKKDDYFTKAAAYADEVIAGRKLTTEFAKLWAADRSGDDNEEFIFDVEYDAENQHDKMTVIVGRVSFPTITGVAKKA